MKHVKIIGSMQRPYDWEANGDFPDPHADVIDLGVERLLRRTKAERISSALSVLKPVVDTTELYDEVQ